MWPELAAWLASFADGVIVTVDADGFPCSTRCTATANEALNRVAISPVHPELLQAGPAGLLCHSHDAATWKLRSFHVTGELVRDGEAWSLTPTRLSPGSGLTGLRGDLAWAREGQRAADRYLAERGLAAPEIDWKEIDAGKREGGALFEARVRRLRRR